MIDNKHTMKVLNIKRSLSDTKNKPFIESKEILTATFGLPRKRNPQKKTDTFCQRYIAWLTYVLSQCSEKRCTVLCENNLHTIKSPPIG